MPLSILLIEDNDLNRRFMTELVQIKHHDVYDVISEDAISDVLNHTSIDLVISDYLLGEGTAEKILRYIRARYPDVALWIVSGVGYERVRSLCEELKITYLEKPLNIDVFLQKLEAEEAACQRAS